MSNVHRLSRAVKASMRRIDYRARVSELLAMVKETERKHKADRLTFAERYRFRRWLFWKYGGEECAYCGKVYPLRDMTVDHIQPLSKGGAMRDIQNMALACLACNRHKGDTWPTV